MLEVRCIGTPYEIGQAHGRQARKHVQGSIDFYTELFKRASSMSWADVLREAEQYISPLQTLAPRYFEEIRGIADGSGHDVLDILALNVRTEIVFGLFTIDGVGRHVEPEKVPSDGCTALAWLTESHSWLAQNWDWMVEQGQNLIVCYISQPGSGIPDIAMVTEAGIIGKIGLNSEGVGCCLNAIRCRGVDRSKLPIHFALRTVLESASRDAAVSQLKDVGIAGSGHILIADATGSVGLECTRKSVKELAMTDGKVSHTNHLVLNHDDVDEIPWLKDSVQRLARIQSLTSTMDQPKTTETVFELFKDTEGYPGSINRQQNGSLGSQTLFNIIMDLSKRKAVLTFGRPTDTIHQTVLTF